MSDLLVELTKLAGVGLTAGLFSSVIANRDHRHRKWWEMRVSAYQNAIEALSDLVYYYDAHYRATIEHRDLSKDFQEKIDSYREQAFPRVRKYADSGAFLFSDEANTALSDFMADESYQDYLEHLDGNLFKAKQCLKKLVECSKVDLKLRSRWRLWFYRLGN